MEQEHNKELNPLVGCIKDRRCSFSVYDGDKKPRICHLSYKGDRSSLYITCNGMLEEKQGCPFWNKLTGDL